MMAGLPRNITILSATMAAILVIGLQKIIMIFIALGLHFLLVFLYKKDDFFMEILAKHVNEEDYLFP